MKPSEAKSVRLDHTALTQLLPPTPSKGALTKAAIVDRALKIASREGLEGLTVGLLAEALAMSKSGVFAHFGSREELQLAVVRESVVQTYDASTFNDTFLRGLLLSIVAENAGQSATSASSATAPGPAEEASASAEEEDEAPSPPPRSHRNVHRLIRTERAGITVTIPGGTTWWDPVSIRPSTATYSRNTQLVDASGVPAGTVCTICQSAPGDDLSGATVLDTMWRKLRGCQHFFHKRCADTWFQNHIQCPNCRADIRTAQPSLPAPEAGPTLDI